MEHSKKLIGIIGLGLVGTSLTYILLEHHYIVYGYDIDSQKLAEFSALGGTACASPVDVANHVHVLLLSLMNSTIVEDVIFGSLGIMQSILRPLLIIDTSTGEPEKSEEFAQHLISYSIKFLESPISGSSKEIKDRSAFFLIGGDKILIQQNEDLFTCLTQKMYHVGPIGMAGRAKLAINLIVGLNRAALAEGLVFAEKTGISLRLALDLFRNSAAFSHVMDTKGEKMIQEDFSHVQAKLSQHRKDVGLILDFAKKMNINLPLSAEHYELLTHAMDSGDGDLDNSAIIKEIRRHSVKK